MALVSDVIRYCLSQIEEGITPSDIKRLKEMGYKMSEIYGAIEILTGKKLHWREFEKIPFGPGHVVRAIEFMKGGLPVYNTSQQVHTTKGWEPGTQVTTQQVVSSSKRKKSTSAPTTKSKESNVVQQQEEQPGWFSRNKGKVALGVGIPVALAAGYYAYKKYKGRKEKEGEEETTG